MFVCFVLFFSSFLSTFGVGRYICVPLGHLLFVVIADFGMLSLELLSDMECTYAVLY